MTPSRRGCVALVLVLFSGGWLATGAQGAGAPGAAAGAGPTFPRPMVIAWSTYLRSGPAETYSATTELEHDTPVQVTGCDGQWCRVSGATVQGYVDRDSLDLPRTLAPSPPANTDCVVVGQADNRGPIPTRFCSASPSAK